MMTLQTKAAVKTTAAILHKLCTPQVLAEILSVTLCADAEPSLSDYEAIMAAELFDKIGDLSPEAIEIAQGL